MSTRRSGLKSLIRKNSSHWLKAFTCCIVLSATSCFGDDGAKSVPAGDDIEESIPWTPLAPETLRASTIHISQIAQGSDTGQDSANSHSVEWFNNASNWSAVNNPGDGIIGPGDTVEFHGVITTRLIVQGCGTAGDGNSIQLTFADDGEMNVPTNPGNTAIAEDARTQIFLGINDYITLMNCRFSSNIGDGDLPDDYASDSNGIMRMQANTLPHYLVFIGYKSSYYGLPENIRIQNCSHNNSHVENNVTAVFLRTGLNILLEGNNFTSIQRGFDTASNESRNITIRNNSLIGSDDSLTPEENRYARLQDIIRLGGITNILIEGNFLSLRKWKAPGEDIDTRAYHSDIIQLFAASGKNPGDVVLRYNYIESDCSPYIDRSWIMAGNLSRTFSVYGNIFAGLSGASNGIRMSGEDPDLKVYIYNNTFVAKGGQGNIIACVRSTNAAAAAGESYFFCNNILYLANDNMGVIYGTATNPPPDNFFRSNNIYFAEDEGGVSWAYAGSTRDIWLAGETNSKFINPEFSNYSGNDFSLSPDSPAIDSGKLLDQIFLPGIKYGSGFPGPGFVNSPSGLSRDIGAYEN